MKTKFFLILALGMAFALNSCNDSGAKNDANDDTAQKEAIEKATREELKQAVADRDQLLELMSDIQQDIIQIKSLENIVSITNNETPSKRAQIKADIAAIQQTLADRQQRLEELTKKLQSSNLYSAGLQKTINELQSQIQTQKQEIDRLTSELGVAKAEIENLGSKVDSLNTTVTNVTDERNEALESARQADNELNACYYAIGSNKELKQYGIVESGFLRRTKIMEGNFDKSFFTKADQRTLKEIPLNSKKAQVLTKQHPTDSYTIRTESNGQKTLVITNPTAFWSVTDYLVVKID